ncbi:MAG: chemotaxis protein CheW [Oscillatoriophycideae cyanobacterium NC_groundwater_1537_Pr4_S-0.65um_50_18]|nr:chemotaxis protein CheW [Oscillatoriophycideae cyanobacterium NC_groundwater_1537_Pr4_S-0.65um_50_18]
MSDSLSIPELQSLPASNLAIPSAAPDSIPADTEQFLRLHLLNTPVLLSVVQMAEVLTIPIGQIIPISHMPAWVMGVHNWRGEVLWMVDLGHLCGLSPWYEQPSVSAHAAVVLQVRDPKSSDAITSAASTSTPASAKKQTLGMVVSQVGEMEWCDPHQIQSLALSSATPEIAQFLRGYWWNVNGDMLAVLDGEAIAQAMP